MKLGLNFKRIIFGVTALLIVMPLFSVQSVEAQALEGTLKKIKDSSTMNLGYLTDAPPFSFLGPDKKPTGYSVELCTRIAGAIQKQLNINLKLNWVEVTAENRISMVEQGKVDIECGTTTTSLSRYEKVDFSLMTYVDGGTMMTLASSPMKNLSDLSGKKIAVIKGTTTETALAKFLKDQFVTSVTLVPVKDHVEGRTALENGTVEAFASDQAILVALALTANDPRKFALADGLFSYEPYAFMLKRNDPSFRLAVNRALANIYRTGEVLPIYDAWFGALGKVGDAVAAMYMINGLPD
jgi:ABC-type amino acid transport substrate-binding protein